MTSVQTESEEQTRGVAIALADQLAPGTVLLLHGDLGAGKTAFVRGLAEGLGLADDPVSSPTFTLVHEYTGGRVPLYHADLYRLPPGASLDDLGLDEVAEDGVLAIEWPERLGSRRAWCDRRPHRHHGREYPDDLDHAGQLAV